MNDTIQSKNASFEMLSPTNICRGSSAQKERAVSARLASGSRRAQIYLLSLFFPSYTSPSRRTKSRELYNVYSILKACHGRKVCECFLHRICGDAVATDEFCRPLTKCYRLKFSSESTFLERSPKLYIFSIRSRVLLLS